MNLAISLRVSRALILVLFACLASCVAMAQGRQSGEIRGTVTDPTHAVMLGVLVSIRGTLTGEIQTATTDGSGVYDFPHVVPGGYTVSFAKDGFKTFVRQSIVLQVQTIAVNAELAMGAATETLIVVAANPDLDTETTDRNTRFSSQLVADAPTGSRNWMDLLASLPGVNPGWGEGSGG